jgi:hypothetical protein
MNAYRQYPGYAGISQDENVATGNYNGLQTAVRIQNRWGLSGEVDYTYSHQIDIQSQDRNKIDNPWYIKYDKGSGAYDRRHIINANYIYNLPIFNKSQGLVKSIAGGWQIAGTLVKETGVPQQVNLGANYDPVGLGGGYTNHPNMTPGGKLHYPKTVVQWFDNTRIDNKVTCPSGQAELNWASATGARTRWYCPAALTSPRLSTSPSKSTSRLNSSSSSSRSTRLTTPTIPAPCNHDGWKDTYSSSLLTDRQSGYVRALGLSSPYTPQVIVDGKDELRLNDPRQVSQVLLKAARAPQVPVSIGATSIDGNSPAVLRAHVEADGTSEKRNADIYAAVALDHAESQVLRGENGGRRLTHTAVVEELIRIGKVDKGKIFSQDFQANLKPGIDPNNLRLVVFVQEPDLGSVLGAAVQEIGHSSR